MKKLSEEPAMRRSELLLSTGYVEPQGDIGETLAGIWRRVLNIDLVGLHDDFFEVGGDSLGASVIAGEIESLFGCKFSPSLLVTASTVAAQVSYVEQQRNRQQSGLSVPSNLIVCNASGRKPPLFIVHGAIGFTFYDKRFMEGFDKDQPVVFIEAIGLDGREPPLDCLKTIAVRYLDALRQVAPEGNWLLAANCAGGLIAMEMCRLAALQGEVVSRLMLVDPMPRLFKNEYQIRWRRWCRRWRSPLPKRWREAWKQFWQKARGSNDDSEQAAYDVALDVRKHRQSDLEMSIRMRTGQQESTLVPSQIAYSAEAMRQVSRNFGTAVENYAVSRWEGKVFILRSSDSCGNIGVLNTYLPNAEVRIVSCSHHRLFTDGLSDIQKFLNDMITADLGKAINP